MVRRVGDLEDTAALRKYRKGTSGSELFRVLEERDGLIQGDSACLWGNGLDSITVTQKGTQM